MMIGSIYNFLAPLGSYRPYSNQTASVQTSKENCIEEEVSRKGRLYRTHDASIASGDRFSRSWLSGHAPARGRAPRPRARHAPAHPRAEVGGGSAPEREYAAAWAATWGSGWKVYYLSPIVYSLPTWWGEGYICLGEREDWQRGASGQLSCLPIELHGNDNG
jgi:hypothetical protein